MVLPAHSITNLKSMFENRTLLIATKHRKEEVISPIFENYLGVKCIVPADFDSDILGTFSGEIERKDNPLETARKKCLLALENSGYDLAIASEGSFGPHPSAYFIAADEEILYFMDIKNELEIFARTISTETNFQAADIKSENELKRFAEKVKFPSHAIIMRNGKNANDDLVKGITRHEDLYRNFNHFISKYGKAYVETDMRAMYNPGRMKVIEKTALDLCHKIQNKCPECTAPGYSIKDFREGLPCELCMYPTKSILAVIYTCHKCHFREEKYYPNGKNYEDPAYCNYCNP